MAWTHGDVVANGVRLHYVRTGGDKPPLVLAHGYSDNGLCWTRVARALETDHDIVMYDARRHGLSEDGPDDPQRSAMAHDAAGLIAALGLKRPGMMGHSMGAAAAALAGNMYGDRLSYVILVDPPWFDEESRRLWDARQGNRPQEDAPKTREEWVARCRRENPNWHEDEVGAWADSKMQFAGRVWAPRRHDPPWREIAERITIPTLLVTGDLEQGAIVSPAVAREALQIMPQAQVAHIAGAGHSIHRDRFEETIAAIKAFVGGL